MAMSLIIYVKSGRVESVLSDCPADMQCLIVRASDEASPQIKGEPWMKSMDFLEADKQLAVLEPVTVEFNPDKVRKIIASGESSRQDLLQLFD